MAIRRPLTVLLALALAAAACGSNEGTEITATDDGPSITQAESEPEATEPETTTESATPAATDLGTFTVDGTEFAVTLLNRCIPFIDDEGNFDLQALAQGQGAKLNLIVLGGFTEVSIDGSGIEDMFGSLAFVSGEGVESSLTDDRWTGSAALADMTESVPSVDVTWDVAVPSGAVDCSL